MVRDRAAEIIGPVSKDLVKPLDSL